MFFKLPLHIFSLLSDYFYKIVLYIVFTKPIRKGGLMETQSNNPFSYHSEESDAEHTASSYSEIPVPESASTEDPSLEKKQKSAAATTIANAGRCPDHLYDRSPRGICRSQNLFRCFRHQSVLRFLRCDHHSVRNHACLEKA